MRERAGESVRGVGFCVRTRGRAGGAHVAREARAYEAQEAQVGQAEGRREKGSRDSLFFSFFFYLGLCVTDCGRRLWGDRLDQFKCCRVFVYPGIFFYCLSSVCL